MSTAPYTDPSAPATGEAPEPGRRPHEVVTRPQGAFSVAACVGCGWVGPARRSLYRIGQDAEAHRLLAHGLGTVATPTG